MSLVSPRQLLDSQKAVLGLNVIGLEHAESFVGAAERTGKGLILQLSENAVKYRGALGPIASALLVMAEQSKAPIALMLDHAENLPLAQDAIAIGFTSVMFDGSKLSYQENLSSTKQLTQLAHSREVFVEAELGEIGGKDGVHAPGVRTNPDHAKDFVSQTQVDALAVAVGSSHAMTEKTAELDFELIAVLREKLEVPLVLHGSSGVNLDNLRKAVSAGIRKINIGTEFNQLLTAEIRSQLSTNPDLVDPRKYLAKGREAMATKAAEYLSELC